MLLGEYVGLIHPFAPTLDVSPHDVSPPDVFQFFSFIYSTTEQYKYSDNVDTNEVETGMTRLIALTVTPVYKNISNMIQVKKDNGTDKDME